jgi:hypothetical protein
MLRNIPAALAIRRLPLVDKRLCGLCGNAPAFEADDLWILQDEQAWSFNSWKILWRS